MLTAWAKAKAVKSAGEKMGSSSSGSKAGGFLTKIGTSSSLSDIDGFFSKESDIDDRFQNFFALLTVLHFENDL